GKYELLSVTNELFAEEIRNLMDRSKLFNELIACDITGGLYLRIPQKIALTQYLLWVFLPDTDQRSQLLLPPPVHVDYRAACFCHRNLIEIGYVCSVCLSSMFPSTLYYLSAWRDIGSPIPPMLRRKIVEQYQKRVSQRKIATSLKLSSSTVHNIIQSNCELIVWSLK
uniref:General transcription factor IIH subunit 3 n=1 Tax=Sinocyclocheilus grahami TaxID=75366 RepID=A0A672QA71_SINGR